MVGNIKNAYELGEQSTKTNRGGEGKTVWLETERMHMNWERRVQKLIRVERVRQFGWKLKECI